MSADLRKSATVQALLSCLVRHLQKQREAVLEQVPPSGGPVTEETRPLSIQLDQLDQALIGLGLRPGEEAT
jgi:hypothetical protein